LDGVGDTLDNNGIIASLSTVEEIPCSLQVSADTDASSDSDLVSWESFRSLVDSSV